MPVAATNPSEPPAALPPSPRAVVWGAVGLLGLLLFTQAMLGSARLAAAFASEPTWRTIVGSLGAEPVPGDPSLVDVPLSGVATVVVPMVLLVLLGGAWRLARRCGFGIGAAATHWIGRAWRWGLIPGMWWLASTICLLAGWRSGSLFLDGTADLWLSLSIAGCLAAWFVARDECCSIKSAPSNRTWLFAAIVISGLTFTALNWGLWFNLRVPHGDSAMYEEHLWNLEHGKGFRSYLDQGLFLGEHVQVVHLLLIPLHWLWPSQLLLELAQAFAMAAGAIPVYRMALRFSESRRAALLLACAYLLYCPLQYLDLTIDLKTFRPNSLGVPALLFALDALERGRRAACIAWLALMLSAQEDYAIVIALLGAWIAMTAGATGDRSSSWSLRAAMYRILSREARPQLLFGGALMVFGLVYLAVVLKVVFPYFRDGATIHYASYFSRFGSTPDEIVWTFLTRPDRVVLELVTLPSMMYAAALLVPLGGLPLRSPGRLLTAAPLFALLCLNDLALQPPAPVHHFHAPLAPLIFWAAAAALRTTAGADGGTARVIEHRAQFACLCALATGMFMSITPLGIKFWDPGGARHWKSLYVPSERARQFRTVDALIPDDARVASTDFVHARLTHRERSYDYSDYVRNVAGFEDRVPDDTGWIVIDIEHPYHSAAEVEALRATPFRAVRELKQEPERWQLVDHAASRYFIVLRRAPE